MTVSDGRLPSSWQAPAQAFARWTALLMGWVWLGQQGQRLSWSIASGVAAVAVWWAVRLVLTQRPLKPAAHARLATLAWGLATAAGATWLSQAAPDGPAQLGLLALAMVWAGWFSTLEQRSTRSPRCQRPWAGWPPLFAAVLTWLAVTTPGPVASAVLLGATALAWASDPNGEKTDHQTAPSGVKAVTIPATAMGWMMGSLWLSNDWCTSAGWSNHAVVGMHLACMAALPALVRLFRLPRALPPMANQLVPLLLVAFGGGLLWAGQALANGLVGMLLLALAWAIPDRSNHAPQGNAVLWTTLAGPMLLLVMGHFSPLWGPAALTWAYGALGALAGVRVLHVSWPKLVAMALPMLHPR